MSQRREPAADDDLPRDERLLEALRHAPDRDVEPPPALSAHILASARAATLQTAPAARAGAPWWARALDALGRPRAPWGPAFATLVVAVLVGVLWSTTRDGEAPAPEAPAGAVAPARDNGPAPATAPPPAGNAAPVEAALPAAQVAPARAPGTTPSPTSPAPTPPAPVVAPTPARMATENAVRERRVAPNEVAAAKVESAPAPEPAARKAAPAAAPPPAAPPAPTTAAAPAPAAALGQAASAEKPPPAGVERRSESADAASRPGLSDRLVAPTRSADPILRLDAALTAQPEAVSWRHALRTHFHESPQRRWWSQLRDDTRGRWRAVQDTRRESVEPWVTVSIEGRRVATFWFDADALWLRDEAGLWRTPATAAQRRAWQATLVTW